MLLEMINDILDLAKMESGKMEVRLSEFKIGALVAAQCDMARPLAEKKNIDLDCDAPASLPPLRQDQAKVQQILNNLLSNAIKFTPEGGRIVVSAERDRLRRPAADGGRHRHRHQPGRAAAGVREIPPGDRACCPTATR